MSNDTTNSNLINSQDYFKNILIYKKTDENNSQLSIKNLESDEETLLLDTGYLNKTIKISDYSGNNYTLYSPTLSGDVTIQLPTTIKNEASGIVFNGTGKKLLYSSTSHEQTASKTYQLTFNGVSDENFNFSITSEEIFKDLNNFLENLNIFLENADPLKKIEVSITYEDTSLYSGKLTNYSFNSDHTQLSLILENANSLVLTSSRVYDITLSLEYSFNLIKETDILDMTNYCLKMGNQASITNNDHSFAVGDHASANGTNSYAFGQYINTVNNQTFFGKYNDSTMGNIMFGIGNGSSNNDRKNIFEIWDDGRLKIDSILTSSYIYNTNSYKNLYLRGNNVFIQELQSNEYYGCMITRASGDWSKFGLLPVKGNGVCSNEMFLGLPSAQWNTVYTTKIINDNPNVADGSDIEDFVIQGKSSIYIQTTNNHAKYPNRRYGVQISLVTENNTDISYIIPSYYTISDDIAARGGIGSLGSNVKAILGADNHRWTNIFTKQLSANETITTNNLTTTETITTNNAIINGTITANDVTATGTITTNNATINGLNIGKLVPSDQNNIHDLINGLELTGLFFIPNLGSYVQSESLDIATNTPALLLSLINNSTGNIRTQFIWHIRGCHTRRSDNGAFADSEGWVQAYAASNSTT